MHNLNWKQQFVLVAGLLLVTIQFFVAGQFSALWDAIWNGNPAGSGGPANQTPTNQPGGGGLVPGSLAPPGGFPKGPLPGSAGYLPNQQGPSLTPAQAANPGGHP